MALALCIKWKHDIIFILSRWHYLLLLLRWYCFIIIQFFDILYYIRHCNYIFIFYTLYFCISITICSVSNHLTVFSYFASIRFARISKADFTLEYECKIIFSFFSTQSSTRCHSAKVNKLIIITITVSYISAECLYTYMVIFSCIHWVPYSLSLMPDPAKFHKYPLITW